VRVEPLISGVIEGLAIEGQSTDVVHDLRRKSSLRLSGISIFSSMERISFSFASLLRRCTCLHFLLLRVCLDIVDVIGTESLDSFLVGADRPLHLVLRGLSILFLDDGHQFLEAFLLLAPVMRL